MRHPFLCALAVPCALASCGHANRPSSADVDLQRDLQLAATSTVNLQAPPVNPANFSRLETAPNAELQPARRLVRGAGPRAVASKAPTLRASVIPEVAATAQVPQLQSVALAPAPVPTTDPVATVPRASGAPQVPGRVGSGDYGGTGHGGGIFGGIGPIIGVVIRGGGVDGDHCEPHGRGRAPGVYLPEPGGFGGGSRFPAFPRGGTPTMH